MKLLLHTTFLIVETWWHHVAWSHMCCKNNAQFSCNCLQTVGGFYCAGTMLCFAAPAHT